MEAAKLANSVSCAGKSRIEVLWDEMDSIMDRLMVDGAPSEPFNGAMGRYPGATGEMVEYKTFDEYAKEHLEWGEERGRAQGIAYALAAMLDPYHMNVPAIKDEAYERWESRQDEAEA